MKNYFSAILLGSLFSCPLFSIGITDEPETLIDCGSEPDVISVEYESYDLAHQHYLVHLTWTDYTGNEWSQRGRLAKLKNQFHEADKRRLMDLRSFDKKQIFYFLSREEPELISEPTPRRRRLRVNLFSPTQEDEADSREERIKPLFEPDDEEEDSEVDGAAQDSGEDTVEFS